MCKETVKPQGEQARKTESLTFLKQNPTLARGLIHSLQVLKPNFYKVRLDFF